MKPVIDPIAQLWLSREIQRREMEDLRRLAAKMKALQDELRPAMDAANARRKANMRQSGPTGFVMVQP